MRKYNAVDKFYQLRQLLAHTEQTTRSSRGRRNVVELPNLHKRQDRAA